MVLAALVAVDRERPRTETKATNTLCGCFIPSLSATVLQFFSLRVILDKRNCDKRVKKVFMLISSRIQL
jgi:hypothetical protein